MRLHYLAIVLGLATITATGCAKKQQGADAKKPIPAATTPSDPQPEATPAPAVPAAPAAPAASEAPAPGS
ncbi:MAG TPA: hypothetical protein VGI70_18345, partial [Polyangiales bacterium]